jgi:predicted MFS family arabinose efflux permease
MAKLLSSAGAISRTAVEGELHRPKRAASIRPLFAALTRGILGGTADRRVRPVAAVSFVYSVSFSTFWVYVGIYAVKGLDWPAARVGYLFLASAPVAAAANYFSGRLADATGRKAPIVLSFVASAANMIALSAVGNRTAAAFVLIVLQGAIGAPAYSLDRVLVADLISEPEEREGGYAAIRVASNVGILVGPPLAALLVYLGGWTAFLLGIAALGAAGAVLAAVLLPATAGRSAETASGSIREVVRDRPFALLLLSNLFSWIDYCGFETVLPVIAVSVYGLSSSSWGLLIAISPALVILGQLRLTRATSRIPAAPRLAGAALLMGLPFLVLLVAQGVAAIAAVIVLFILGEMIWMPTSQTIAAELAPEPARGTYFGALAAMTGPAWTLAPFIAFQLREHLSVGSVWVLFAAVSAAAAAAGVIALRAQARRIRGSIQA